jgi:hypothetical protein
MATLKSRLVVLERTSIETNFGGYFDFLPVMAYDEWCEFAAKQQAELGKRTS